MGQIFLNIAENELIEGRWKSPPTINAWENENNFVRNLPRKKPFNHGHNGDDDVAFIRVYPTQNRILMANIMLMVSHICP